MAMLKPKKGLKVLKGSDEASREGTRSTAEWKVPASLEGRADTLPPDEGTGAGDPVAAPALFFPGYKETRFSTPTRHYFYKGSRGRSGLGSGSFGVVEKVYWYNPDTGLLEFCIAKSANLAMAVHHPNGWWGLRTNALLEAAALEWLEDVPGVVDIRDIIIHPNGPIVLIMEDAPGVDLTVWIRDRSMDDTGLSWQEIRTLLRKLAQVLAEIHRRSTVHGDLKPANIHVSADKTLVTLLDFGAASVSEEGGWDFPGGTIVFAAPELLLAARSNRNEDAPPCWVSCSPPIDCWSYGLTALELLTGCCLFAPDKTARPSDIGCEGEHDYLGRMKYTADLHGDWEESSELLAIHEKFRSAVEQLAEVSEDFKREGVSFVRGLLHPNPRERLTAEQALLHPFLTKDFVGAALDNKPPAIKIGEVLDDTEGRSIWVASLEAIQNMGDDDDDEDEDGDPYTDSICIG